MHRVLYKPLGMLVSVLGGLVASALFKRVWRAVSGDEETPEATDATFGWTEVLIAATVQGAIFGLVKAAIDRGGAAGYRKLTGAWPGEDEHARS